VSVNKLLDFNLAMVAIVPIIGLGLRVHLLAVVLVLVAAHLKQHAKANPLRGLAPSIVRSSQIENHSFVLRIFLQQHFP